MAPPRLSRTSLVVAVVVALIPAVWLGSKRLVGDDAPANRRVEPAIPAVTTPGVPAKPKPSATKAPGATVTAATPGSLPRVAVDVPRRLSIGSTIDVGFDDSVEPRNGIFSAGSTAEAARWGSRGLPGSPGTDTVFVIGKVYRQGDAAFDGLQSVEVGDKVVVRTDNGTLTYTVQVSEDRAAAGIASTSDFTAKVAGRLVLLGVLFDATDDDRTGKYRVVVAQLSAARPG